MELKELTNRIISRKRIISALLILIMAFTAFWIYSETLSSYLKEEAFSRLTEVAQSSKISIYRELNEKQATLYQISNFVEDEENMTSKEVMGRLKAICKDDYFTRIGIIYPNKDVYITDDLGEKVIHFDEIGDYFYRGMQGKTAISRMYEDSIGKKDVMIFSRPLYGTDNNVKGVLFASYEIKTLQNLLSVNLFDGHGYSVVINKDGTKIVAGLNALPIKNDTRNVFMNLKNFDTDNISVLEKAKADLIEDKSGLALIQAYEPMYLYYQPLGMDNLSIITIIPKSVIETKYDMLMRNVYILSGVLLILVIMIVINIVLDERRKKRQLENILYKDKVTGGYSYTKFCMIVKEWLENSQSKKAFISFDIDNFKLINDIYGYKIGNIVLSDVWQVLKSSLKRHGFITRTYADNFLIAVEFEDKAELVTLTEDIVRGIGEITTIKKEKFRIISSMGIYIVDDDGGSVENMQNRDMMARRLVKNKYDNFYRFYYDDIKNTVIEKKTIMDGILQALALNEFYAYYQPKYDAQTKKMIGGEALIRWIKNEKTFISPAKFIPIAEEVGIIIDIDRYIFESVCRQQSEWKQKGLAVLPISVNVSRHKLYQSDFIKEYTEILHKYGLNPSNIQFEITEGNLFSEQKIGEQIVDKLRQAGFDVLIDDFGTGYSSVSMIRDINAAEMKIDKSFVDDMSDKGKAIIQHVIAIAKTVGMKTVAEGVETKQQYEFLRDNGCDIIQGYYFAKPMPAAEYETYLEKSE